MEIISIGASALETSIIEVPFKYPTIAYSIPVSSVYPQTSDTPKLFEALSNVILCTIEIL